jgi:hypothetical protein
VSDNEGIILQPDDVITYSSDVPAPPEDDGWEYAKTDPDPDPES